MKKGILLLVAAAIGLGACTKPADRVLLNAKVYSVGLDNKVERSQALAIRDGRIVCVGSKIEVFRFIGKKTRITDCKGVTVLPAFNDGYMDFGQSVSYFCSANLYPSRNSTGSVAQVQKVLRSFAAAHPDETVIHGRGWDRSLPLTRHDIDAIIADRPVVLVSRCGNAAVFNSMALEMVGLLSSDIPDPPVGVLKRDSDGMPNGYVQEPVLINSLCAQIPDFEFAPELIYNGIMECQKMFVKNGYSILCDWMKTPGTYEVVSKMAKDGDIAGHLFGAFVIGGETCEEDFQYACRNRSGYGVPGYFTVDAVTYRADGLSGSSDRMLWDTLRLRESMIGAQQAGFNIYVRTNGDAALRVAINALVDAQKCDPEHKLRNVVAHGRRLPDSEKNLMDKNGIAFGNGCGFPEYVPDPFRIIQLAMKTDGSDGLRDAVKSLTVDVAYQFHCEGETGSLEEGKLADIIILNADLEDIPVKNVSKVKVAETILKGKSKYKIR